MTRPVPDVAPVPHAGAAPVRVPPGADALGRAVASLDEGPAHGVSVGPDTIWLDAAVRAAGHEEELPGGPREPRTEEVT